MGAMKYEDLKHKDILSRLVVRLYQTPIQGKNNPDDRDYAYKVDFADTCTVLALDLDDHFEIMHRSKLKERRIPEDAAFTQAMQNIHKVPADLNLVDFDIKFEGFEMWQVKADFFAAAQLITISEQFPMLIGEQGALVCIPSSSLGLVVPINVFDHEAVCAIAVRLLDLSYEIYSEATHPIIYHVYWWKEGEFHRVPIESTNKGLLCRLPQLLEPVWIKQIEEAEKCSAQEHGGFEPASDIKYKSHAEFDTSHTNTKTGHVVTFRRDCRGKVLDVIDSFKMENFEEIKRNIEHHFESFEKFKKKGEE